MKRLIIEKIDGCEVVSSIRNAAIDPVAINKEVVEQVEKSNDYLKFMSYLIQYKTKLIAYLEAKDKIDLKSLRRKSKPDYSSIKNLWDEMQESSDLVESQRKKILELEEKIRANTVVYCDVPKDEYLVGELLSIDFSKKLKLPNTAVLTDGSCIPDYRNKVYWVKEGVIYEKYTITKLGEAPCENSISPEELTPKQQRLIHLQSLTEEQIQFLKDKHIEALKNQAAVKAMKLQMEGKEGIQEANHWLNNELMCVDLIFSVEGYDDD